MHLNLRFIITIMRLKRCIYVYVAVVIVAGDGGSG